MGRFTFYNADSAATFGDLFSDSRTATWYQLWVGNSSGKGVYVDTSAFNSHGNGWIIADDLNYLDVDFAQADDITLWLRPWDGSAVSEPWEWGNIDFSYARTNYINTTINENTSMDQMFTDFDVSNNTWYRLWIGDFAGTIGDYVDTSGLNEYGSGWVTPENLSNLTFSLDDAGKDLWVQTVVLETDVKNWEHWTIKQEFAVTSASVFENVDSITFTVSLPKAVAIGEAVIFNYTTANGTALAGEDYESVSGTLTFEAGESSKEILVNILDDTRSGEENEIFTFVVSNTLQDDYIDQVFGNAIIIDNDDFGNESITTPLKLGSEFLVNTQTDYNQEDPVITTTSDGGFVVVWESENQDGSEYGIFGQRFDINGDLTGSEFQVNTYTDNFQWAPAAASFSDGGFVVVWQSAGQDGSGYGIYGQRYDALGNIAGGEFQVNTQIGFNQEAPSIASFQDNGFVVTWQSAGQDGSGSGIYGQMFDNDGAMSGAEFAVNTTIDGIQDNSFVIPLLDGKFAVIWSSDGQDGSGYGIYGQLFEADAQASGTEFLVNTTTEGDQNTCSGAYLADGGFVVVWASADQDGSGYGVYGQRFDSDGVPIDAEFIVNNYTFSNQEAPSVTSLADGGFIVAWESYGQDGSQEGVYGQRFNGIGEAVGDEFQINTATSEDQDASSVAALFDKGFVATWGSDDQDGSFEGIYGQIFSINSAEFASTNFNDTQGYDMNVFGIDPIPQIELMGIQTVFQDGLFHI
ncbi:MAG: hypothetical protein PF495_04485 [Spirochaetales bacterium]|jgi:hypothetical protein|nr:hypothetical protein [Spirochaetales bacterium]